jgi:hypothetical protein
MINLNKGVENCAASFWIGFLAPGAENECWFLISNGNC